MSDKQIKESFMVIGISTFSRYLIQNLHERNFKIIAIDLNEDRLDSVKPYLTKGIVGDASDMDFLKKAGVEDVDAIILSLGSKTDDSLVVLNNLHELEIENIYVKVVKDSHASIVHKLGASEVIFPEKESAIRLAQRIDNPNILDFVPLSEDYSIIDWTPEEEMIGKTLRELDLKNEYNVQVISIENDKEDTRILPKPYYKIKEGDVLVVVGENDDLNALKDSD
jgi:trk system potassium uptake protein TrkA